MNLPIDHLPKSDNPKLQAYLKRFDPKSPENVKKEKERRADNRRKWWRENWISFSSLVVALTSLGISILALSK